MPVSLLRELEPEKKAVKFTSKEESHILKKRGT